MSTSMKFVAPHDLSVGRVTISNAAGTVHEWVATPDSLEFQLPVAKPGYYVAEIAPAGVSPQSVIFHINEGEANNVTVPAFAALKASGSGPDFLGIRDEHAALWSLYKSESRSSEKHISHLTPVRIESRRRHITVGISQEIAAGRKSFGPFAGTHRYEMVGDRVLIEVTAERNSDLWAGRRVRLSASIEGLKLERQLLPMYRGGTIITLEPSPLASADVAYQVIPADPRIRALLRALQAGTSREAAALCETILNPKRRWALLSRRIGDPWAAILAGLLFIRFPDSFGKAEKRWADALSAKVNWAYDTHVIRAQSVLSAAGGSLEDQMKAAMQAVELLAMAQRRGSPYYSYTNQLFGEMAESLNSFLTPDSEGTTLGETAASELQEVPLARTVLARWRRDSALQSSNGATFTWLSRDQKALKEMGLLTPRRSPSGRLRARDTTVVLDGVLEGGRIALGGTANMPKPAPPVRGQASYSRVRPPAEMLGFTTLDPQPSNDAMTPGATRAARDLSSSDPNKGQFGGKAELDGFRVDATFRPGPSRKWVTIVMTVTAGPDADIELGDVAWFDLHPTFPQRKVKVLFNERRATLSTMAWGGFTLGVFLPRQDIKLECDLAKLKDAPTIIKTR
jgi:hypothetical protein